MASLKEEGSWVVVCSTRLDIFLGLKIPFWLRVTIVRLESKGGSTLEAREKDYGKVGEEGGLDGTSGKSNRVEIGTESVGIVTGEEKLGWGLLRFLEDCVGIERILESKSVEEELDDAIGWEDKDFVKNGNWVSSNTIWREAYIREEAISK